MVKLNFKKSTLVKWGVVAAALLVASDVFANADATTINKGLEGATSTLVSIGKTAINLINAMCGVASVYGIFSAVKKMMNKEQDAGQAITSWVGGIVALTALVTVVNLVFFS